jgi:predicted O-methyltransferase YrrM
LAHDKFITITPELHRYSVEHSSFRDGAVPGVERAGEAMGDLASMQIAGDQAAFMTILVRAIGAHDALEVGTFLGYGALAIARGLPDDGRLVCCELSEEYAERARDHLREASLDGKVEVRVGAALETLRAMEPGEQFDFAFIDADKTNYGNYYDRALKLVRPGGLIAIDNVLWGGDVADPKENDEDTKAIRALNEKVRNDERVTLALAPIGDGLTLARKR